MEEPAADARGVQEPDHRPGARPIREQRAAKLGVQQQTAYITKELTNVYAYKIWSFLVMVDNVSHNHLLDALRRRELKLIRKRHLAA